MISDLCCCKIEIGNLLHSNKELINKFILEGMAFKVWKSKIINMFKASQVYGPTFTKGSKNVNYFSIQKKF